MVNGGDNGRIERGSQGKIEGRRVKREEIMGKHIGNTLGKEGDKGGIMGTWKVT